MRHDNICKFGAGGEDRLAVTQFVLESHIPPEGVTFRPDGTDGLFLVAEGKGAFTVGGTRYPLGVGDAFFLFSGETYRAENGGGFCYLYLRFSGSRVDELRARAGVTPSRRCFSGMEALIPLWKESLVSAREDNLALLSESMLLYAFAKLQKESAPARDAARAVILWLEEHYTERDCTLSRMASELQYNVKYLSHLVKSELGVGFSEYLMGLRLRHAVLLVRQGVTSVKNIAILSGFSDPLYFSRVFREKMGVSPRDYIAGTGK